VLRLLAHTSNTISAPLVLTHCDQALIVLGGVQIDWISHFHFRNGSLRLDLGLGIGNNHDIWNGQR
jgi:hypothetical protein